MSGNFLSCIKGVKDPLEVQSLGVISLKTPQWKWASSGLEGRTSWILELRQVLSTYDGDLRDPLWWSQEGQSPSELLGGLSGFLSRRCRGLRFSVDSVSEHEDSSPILTWILGYFWSLPRGVSPRLEGGMHLRFPPEL